MRITILGSGTGVPDARACSPAVFVSIASENLLIDIGPGVMRQLAAIDLTYHDVDKLLLTHTHIDHINDLTHLIFASKFDGDPRSSDLQIVAPKGFKKFYTGLLSLFGEQLMPKRYNIDILEVSDSLIEFDGWSLVSKPTKHLITTVGFRLQEGESVFAYTGDTELVDEVIELAKDADLLVAECAFPDDPRVVGHLTPESVAELIKTAKPKRTLLVHIYPLLGRRDAVIQVRNLLGDEFKVELAEDLSVVELH